MIVNFASVVFWNELLAKVILITFILSAIFMMGLYSRFGFEKILEGSHSVDSSTRLCANRDSNSRRCF